MEAMAAGCAVVACRAGGIPDAVEDGVTGFLFDPGEQDGLLKAAKRALGDQEKLDAVRKRGREDVERHGWDEATEQLRELYAATIRDYQYVQRPAGPAKRLISAVIMAVLRRALP
jgi:glycosyltransferase involved in cell wall biosynthesis